VKTVIFRTIAPYLTALMILFSLFVLLRGHNEPGGGFIGGLIAASALAIYGIAAGVSAVRRALFFSPIAFAGFGLLLATAAGLPALAVAAPFLTGLWFEEILFGFSITLSTPLVFDIGVYLIVVGALSSIAFALEGDEP
jgi:multicomponent Na+:H+ antiporter subunit B